MKKKKENVSKLKINTDFICFCQIQSTQIYRKGRKDDRGEEGRGHKTRRKGDPNSKVFIAKNVNPRLSCAVRKAAAADETVKLSPKYEDRLMQEHLILCVTTINDKEVQVTTIRNKLSDKMIMS